MDYEVIDVPEPKLYKSVFPWDLPPRIVWDGVVVPMEVPNEIWLSDTTFRDGQQAREPYTIEQYVKIYEYLHRISGPRRKVDFTECFLYTARDKRAIEELRGLGLDNPRVTGWIRASEEDLKEVKEARLEETGMLASISDYHIFYKFKGLSRSQVIQKYLEVVEEGLRSGIAMRAHVEDCTRADVLGVVVPFARKLMRLADKYGVPVKIRVPDTLGVGLPWPEAALPRSVPKIMWVLHHLAGVPSKWLEFHGHNDLHFGVANATAAWLYGAASNSTTLFGIGERAGNVPLEAMVFVYASIKGSLDEMDTRAITEAVKYYERELNYSVPIYYPIIGRNFNVTRAGIHADGTLKNIEMYLPFDTEKLLGRAPAVSITPYSGVAGVAFWVNHYFNLREGERVDKGHPEVMKIFEAVSKKFEEGALSISDEEMARVVRERAPQLWEKYKNRIERR